MLRWLIVGIFTWAPPGSPECIEYEGAGHSVEIEYSRASSVCWRVRVPEQAAVQVRVTQPLDLKVTVDGAALGTIVIDAFEFGIETITLNTPGSYKLEASPARSDRGISFTATMTTHASALQEAELWRESELLSSRAKASADPEVTRAALRQRQAIGDASGIARLQLRLGDLLLNKGDFPQAHIAYDVALRLCEGRAESRCVAEAANNLGIVARRVGDIDSAERRLLQAANEWKALAEKVNQGLTLSNLGVLQRQSGDFGSALRSYAEAMKLLESTNRPAYARVLNNLGLTYISLAEYGRASAVLRSAIREYARARLPLAVVRGNLGWSYLREGKLAVARAALHRSLAEAGHENNSFARVPALINLGETYRRLGNRSLSREMLHQALTLSRAQKDRQFEGLALSQLGQLARQEGNCGGARESLTNALTIHRSLGERDAESEALVALARVEQGCSEGGKAREYAEAALKLLESIRSGVSTPALRASYYSRKRTAFDLLLDLTMSSGGGAVTEEGLLLMERVRGRALLDLLADDSFALASPESARERAQLQRRISFLSSSLVRAQDQGPIRDQVHMLLARHDALEARIHDEVSAGAVGQPLDTVKRLRESLPAGAALLAFHLGSDRSYLWLVEPGAEVRVYVLPPRRVVEARVASVKVLFDDIAERRSDPAKQRAFSLALRRLGEAVLGPLRGVALPRLLILALDGALQEAPVAALVQPGRRNAIGLAHEVIHVPSGTFLTRASSPRLPADAPKTALVAADPVFSSTDPRVIHKPRVRQEPGLRLPRLPFNQEIETLQQLIPARRLDILRGFDATVSALERRLSDYAVIHLSTHTLIDQDEPQMSHIALSLVDRKGRPIQGLVRPQHVFRWRMQRALVVLSSCETALGRRVLGEGLAGFTTPFFIAGASQLIMSTSQVDAEASAEFFTHFYRSYLSGNNGNLQRSIRTARLRMAASRRWSDPYYWASFAAIGNISRHQ